jgi:hypothetical protein
MNFSSRFPATPARGRLRRVRALLRRRTRVAAVLLATAAMAVVGGVGVVGTAAPAFADDPGQWCQIFVSGAITAPSTAHYGDLITVHWEVSSYCDDGLVAFVDGPQFGGFGEQLPLGGSRDVRAVTDGTTMTWRLSILDLDSDSPIPAQLASVTITVL